MKQLIVTADDYGMSRAVNQAIQEGIENGVITTTNVMMNMPFCDETERICNKGASIGLHWNLTCGKPVLPPEQVPSIVDGDGNFHSITAFRRLYKSGAINEKDVEKELTAQYRKYQEIWGEPEYWNSHENVHLWLKTFQVFLRTASELNIRKMRSHDRIYVPAKSGRPTSSAVWRMLEPAKKAVFAYWRKEAERKGITSPDGKICCLDEKDIHDLEYILKNIQWNKAESAEFTIHPAVECDSQFFGSMTENRLTEYRMVIDPGIHNVIRESNIILANFDCVK